jgi:hypothetical protein
LTGRERGRTTTVVLAGLVLLWVSALLSLPIESGDCGGSPEVCAAAATGARDHVRLIVFILLAMTVLALGALRTGYPLADVVLLASSAALVLLGLWVIVAENGRPLWLPAGFMFMIPAALVLIGGTARRLMGSRDIRRR